MCRGHDVWRGWRGHARSSRVLVMWKHGLCCEEVDKEQKMRKPASIEREARNPRKAEKGAWLRSIISRRETERIHESACGPGNSPPLLLTVKESAFGPGNSPPLLLTVKGQLPSPTALYKSVLCSPHYPAKPKQSTA